MNMKKNLHAHIRGWFPQEPQLPKPLKIKLESHKRNWFPKDPLIAAIKTTEDEKFNRWTLCPFLTPGALMVLSALLAAPFGLLLVYLYLQYVIGGPSVSMYSVPYPGILSVGAIILGFLSGTLLLANRSIVKAVAGIVTVFSFGIVILVIPPLLNGWDWVSCAAFTLPMIVLSATSLIFVGLNYIKLKRSLITKENNTTNETDPTTIPMVQDSAL
jgi:hypothetical protein